MKETTDESIQLVKVSITERIQDYINEWMDWLLCEKMYCALQKEMSSPKKKIIEELITEQKDSIKEFLVSSKLEYYWRHWIKE